MSERKQIVGNVHLLRPQGASAIAGLSARLSPPSVWKHRSEPQSTTWPHGRETERRLACGSQHCHEFHRCDALEANAILPIRSPTSSDYHRHAESGTIYHIKCISRRCRPIWARKVQSTLLELSCACGPSLSAFSEVPAQNSEYI